MTKFRSILFTLPLISLTVAHAQMAPGTMSAPAVQPNGEAAAALPLTEGEVRRVDKERGEVVLKHGDLPNLGMPAMTMAFNVPTPSTLEKLKAGDKVRLDVGAVEARMDPASDRWAIQSGAHVGAESSVPYGRHSTAAGDRAAGARHISYFGPNRRRARMSTCPNRAFALSARIVTSPSSAVSKSPYAVGNENRWSRGAVVTP